jgi:hypothetical protein
LRTRCRTSETLAPPEAASESDEKNPGEYQQRTTALMNLERQPVGPGAKVQGMMRAQAVQQVEDSA